MSVVACRHGLRTCLLCEIEAASQEPPPVRDVLAVLEARQADTDSALLEVSRRVAALEHQALGEQAAQNHAADAGERVLAALEARAAALEAQVAQLLAAHPEIAIAQAVRAELLKLRQQYPLGLR